MSTDTHDHQPRGSRPITVLLTAALLALAAGIAALIIAISLVHSALG